MDMIVVRPSKNSNYLRIYFFNDSEYDIGIVFISDGQLAIRAVLMNLLIESKMVEHFHWKIDSGIHDDYKYQSTNHASIIQTVECIKHVAVSHGYLFRLLPY